MSNRTALPQSQHRLPLHRLLSSAVLAVSLPLAMAACAGPRAADEMPSAAVEPAAAQNPGNVAPGEPSPMPSRPTCNAAPAKASLVGKTADAATVEQAKTSAGGHTVRVLKPGQMITKEYLDGRVNVHVDENNVIVDIGCG